MSGTLEIRPTSRDEFATAVEWAAAEGWNPGLDDLDIFHQADPRGFLMGWIDDKPVSSISVVRYGKEFGFLGFYIVQPEHRGQGVGIATWNAGLEHLKDRTISLDGVVDQQENYRKSGFDYVGRNIRFSRRSVPEIELTSEIVVRHANEDDLQAIQDLDRKCFGAPREAFIQQWCLPEKLIRRTCFVAEQRENLVGFGTIRQCRIGHKIGPLFCEGQAVARALLSKLCSAIDKASEVFLDVPETNLDAITLAKDAGFQFVFETARMVRGTPPEISWNAVYGVTSFELG